MKKLNLLICFLVFACVCANAQVAVGTSKFTKLDDSPLDVLYYPLNVTKDKGNAKPIIRVLYSRPQKKGREIFGVLEQFDKVWRLGANESTEIWFDKTVTIANKKIKAGRYSLFAIPSKDKWIIIVNKQTDKWGAFSYDSTADVLRTEVPVKKLDNVMEALSMTFADYTNGAELIIAWDKTQVSLPITFTK
jgi:hypothetical protein